MFSAAGLIALSPVLAAIALIVRIADGRPILFRQRRIGRRGRPFVILKFRTMSLRGEPAQKITVSGDSRVTKVGSWLRKFKLDELPQLINVLRGEMSLIGPRPEVPEYVDHEDALWQSVLAIRPGITDAASLVFRDEEEVLGRAVNPSQYYRAILLPAKLRLTLKYQQSRSYKQDFRLLWKTAIYSIFPGRFDRDRILREFDAENIWEKQHTA